MLAASSAMESAMPVKDVSIGVLLTSGQQLIATS